MLCATSQRLWFLLKTIKAEVAILLDKVEFRLLCLEYFNIFVLILAACSEEYLNCPCLVINM